MKIIIDKKMYDTETAIYVGGKEFSHRGDYRHREKYLYKTKKGQYFRYDSGGALTDMAKSCGNNSTTGSSEIRLLTKDEAYQFLEEHDSEACKKEFEKEIIEG